ncbi:MAG TPA: hypothetical protein PKA37_02490 [Planctomycetota bacterium]|nr:hypothetical protein [Planctomycetota bacterium]
MRRSNECGVSSVEALLGMSLMLVVAGGLLTALVANNARTQHMKTDAAMYDQASVLYERMMGIPFGSASSSSPNAVDLMNLVGMENSGNGQGQPPTQVYNGSNLNLRQVALSSPLVWRYVAPTGGPGNGQGNAFGLTGGNGVGNAYGLGNGGGNGGPGNFGQEQEANNPLAGQWEVVVTPDLNGLGFSNNPLNTMFQGSGDVLLIQIKKNNRVLKSGIRSRTPEE